MFFSAHTLCPHEFINGPSPKLAAHWDTGTAASTRSLHDIETLFICNMYNKKKVDQGNNISLKR